MTCNSNSSLFKKGQTTVDVAACVGKIQATEMYQTLGLGFLPLRDLHESPGENADDIIVVMGTGSVLPIHIHPREHHNERWEVLCGIGKGYLGEITNREGTDKDMIDAWNERQETNISDGELAVDQILELTPGTQVDIRAGQAHGCNNPGEEPLVFYASIFGEDGSHAQDPTQRKLRGVPKSVTLKTLRTMLGETGRKLLSLN